ncbi:unnamed protein product [Effrenium voratum]|uniref:FYVE-type domain-containing protein n=1 Tax=Effrenium voratum TaxID=2562239 RepID=A0AA36JPF0_9DINO|nr:unnamed protein product [Effrenium voratum]
METEGWDMVEDSQVHTLRLHQRDLHHQRCKEELSQAQQACEALIKAQQEVASGILRCGEQMEQVDQVHRAFCIPKTSVPLEGLIWDCPLVVRTCGKHSFSTGQNVIITGVRVKGDASTSLQSLVRELSRDHAVVYVDECRFALGSMGTLICEEEEASMLDFTSAQAALNISCWGLGKTYLSHTALHITAETLQAVGLPKAVSKIFMGLRMSCEGVQTMAEAYARHVEHTHNITPPGKFADSLGVLHAWLRRVSDVQGPDVRGLASHLWDRTVEAVQPVNWQPSVLWGFCAECFASFERSTSATGEGKSKHHCRHCGRVVCDNCSKDREMVPWHGHTKAVRVCKVCLAPVKVRNLSLQQYSLLNEQVAISAMGLREIIESPKPKGRGKGKPPGPVPTKGKGKGVVKKRQDLKPGHGLGALGEDIKSEIGELAGFVVVQNVVKCRAMPKAADPGIAILVTKEELLWGVASHGYKTKLDEIIHCLLEVTLEAPSKDQWFESMEQILPLEKLSHETLEKLKAVPAEKFPELREIERVICEKFLPVDHLALRWRALKLQREYETPELRLARLDVALAAIQAPLADGHLVSEVKNMIAVLRSWMEPNPETLQGLVSRIEVGSGKDLLQRAWQVGDQYRVCNASGFVDALAPLEDCTSAIEVKDILQKLLADRKELQDISQRASDVEAINSAAKKLEGVFQALEVKLVQCLDAGHRLRIALGQLSPDTEVVKFQEAAPLACATDQNLKSLRSLVQGLRKAQQAERERQRFERERELAGRAEHAERRKKAKKAPPAAKAKVKKWAVRKREASPSSSEETRSSEAEAPTPQAAAG